MPPPELPDIFVVCNRDKLKNNKHVYGNPDFVVEVLSPSTKNTDIFVKCQAYREAGVKEYWIIDPDKKVIIVHLFGENTCTNMYGFADQVPISIYNGEFEITDSDIVSSHEKIIIKNKNVTGGQYPRRVEARKQCACRPYVR